MIGGYNYGSLRSTEYLDLKTNTFSQGPQMQVARSNAAAVQIDERQVLVAGGDYVNANKTTEVLDLTTGEFSQGPALLSDHDTARAVCV